MEGRFKKFKKFLRTFPKKHHVEYITALLSIPVLLSVVALNILNLQGTRDKKDTPPSPPAAVSPVIIKEENQSSQQGNSESQNKEPVCKKELGPVEISYPKEGETVNTNPVCINIKYDDENYCSAVWSYRINDGTWSNFSSNDPCLYNLPDGDIRFELRAQSTVSEDEDILERNFKYQGKTATQSASQSNL